MQNRPIPMEKLRVGQTARISRIQGSPDHVHRLEEFGLRSGTCIEMFRTGNPCIIRMAGNKICFRAETGLSISVVLNPLAD
jgi:Fe2+ transport system protein FeoA